MRGLPELRAKSIQLLTSVDLDRITAIHTAAFPDSVLSKLGNKPVRRYYQWLLLGPHDAVALGVRHADEIAGFLIAGVFRNALKSFIRKNCIALVWGVVSHPSLLAKQNDRRRLVAGIRAMIPCFMGEAKTPALPTDAFGVLVLAMDPAYQRSGYGRLLMNACHEVAVARKFSVMRLTVHPTNDSAIRFYELLGWSKSLVDGEWKGVMFKSVSRSAAADGNES